MSEHQKIFTFSFELEHILEVKNSIIVKSKDVLFDNNTNFSFVITRIQTYSLILQFHKIW